MKLKYSKPKIKKPSKSTLKRKADILLSKFIRSLDHCERCGTLKNLQAAHIYSRRFINLRYDIQNVICLCSKCHFQWHDSPLDSMIWFNQAYPERVKYLVKKKQIIKKWTVNDYLKTIEEIKNYVR